MKCSPRGKGMFIHQVAQCERGEVSHLVEKAVKAGLTHVLIKIADGRGTYNGEVAGLVQRLAEAGVEAWAWQYTYGNHPREEAECGATRFATAPFVGFVVDAEVEYKGRPEAAARYIEALREKLPEVTLALSSFYLPDYHSTFPWTEFLHHCDLNMPQVYWFSRGPVVCLEKSLGQNARFGRPVFPTGAAYRDAATAPQVAEFLTHVRSHGLPGANFWSWQDATPQMWQVIAQFPWPQPRVVVAIPQDDDFSYHTIPSRLRQEQFWVRRGDLAAAVGRDGGVSDSQPLRQVVSDLGLNAEFNTRHLTDPDDPVLYVFIYGSGEK